MISREHQYTVALDSDFPQWWRYNVYIMVIGYDSRKNRISFESTTDKIYDINPDSGPRSVPDGYPSRRTTAVSGPLPDFMDVYVYVVANTFPDSPIIKDSPPFSVKLTVSAGDRVVEQSVHEVNQWGGLTIVARRVDFSGQPL